MNEKIKALIELATETVPLYYGPAGIAHTKKFNKEKFAELIVLECANVAGNPDVDMLRVGRAIKEHFGVK